MQASAERDPTPPRNGRRDPRALVCARALLKAANGTATEHLTYDLSAGGVRLCGIPRAEVGDRVGLLLQLPRAWVPAAARLVRMSEDGSPEFALRLEDVDPRGEDTIQDAVLEALDRGERRSVLLLRDARERPWKGWEWLAPVSPICTAASTPLEAVQRLEEHDIRIALLGEKGASQLAAWKGALPELTWRSVDGAGRLWSLDATRPPRALH